MRAILFTILFLVFALAIPCFGQPGVPNVPYECTWDYSTPRVYHSEPDQVGSKIFIQNLSFEKVAYVFAIWRVTGTNTSTPANEALVIDPPVGNWALRPQEDKQLEIPQGFWSLRIVSSEKLAVWGVTYGLCDLVEMASALTFIEQGCDECCETEECEECEECPSCVDFCHVAPPHAPHANGSKCNHPWQEIDKCLPLPAYTSHIREHDRDYPGKCDGRTNR